MTLLKVGVDPNTNWVIMVFKKHLQGQNFVIQLSWCLLGCPVLGSGC